MKEFLVSYTWAGHGTGVLGTMQAASQKKAQESLLDLIGRSGHPRHLAAIETIRNQSITLMNGFEMQVSPMPDLANGVEHMIAMILHGMDVGTPSTATHPVRRERQELLAMDIREYFSRTNLLDIEGATVSTITRILNFISNEARTGTDTLERFLKECSLEFLRKTPNLGRCSHLIIIAKLARDGFELREK